MSKIRKFLEQTLLMPYFKNFPASSGKVNNIAKHEDAVENLLLNHGFKKHAKGGVTKKQRDEWLRDPHSCSIPDGTYITQPTGSQNSPDFIVKEDGRAYFIECKSSNTSSPMYNGGIPKNGYIYIFTSKKYNQTTIFDGCDVISDEQYKLILDYISECRKRDKLFNEKINSIYNIEFYTRPMLQHRGGVDYFANPNRKQIEQKVLNNV